MSDDLAYFLVGASLLLAVVLPHALRRVALSAPIVLVLAGLGIGLLPAFDTTRIDPLQHGDLAERLAELCVIVALMGVGLALDRPLTRSRSTWRAWRSTWRLLAIAMPACIVGVALLGWGVMGLTPAAALLLGAALAPTDPVLAADVQVEGPTTQQGEHVDERDEVRFALTSEAGLNDALAFPFVYAAIYLAEKGHPGAWWAQWVAWELTGKVLIGVAVGVAGGWVFGKLAFSRDERLFRFAEQGEPLLALAAILAVYGLAELAGGWGFIAVFVCALRLRLHERHHDYHGVMHQLVERLELMLTLLLLLLLGVALGDGLLAHLTWEGALVGMALLLLVRPVTAWLALGRETDDDIDGDQRLGPRERLATAFFGVRGIGSIYYVAYALGQAHFPEAKALWSTVGFTIVVSVLLHGMTATPVMRALEAARRPADDV